MFKKVKVTWYDAVSEDSWTDISEAVRLDPHEQETLGFLIFENEKKVVVAPSWDKESEKVASFYSIPRTWIIAVEEL